jgi:hypothetical protein
MTATEQFTNTMQKAIWWIRMIAIVAAVGWTAWSGFKAGEGDSRKWYDRTIRLVGGLIVLAGLTFGLILVLSNNGPK